jgi:hypothetical protein
MACPGSLKLSEGRPNESGEAAMQGTAAHHLGETCLKEGSDAEKYLGQVIALDQDEDCYLLDPRASNLEELLTTGAIKATFEVDSNMADAVQVYLTAVRDEMERMGPDAELAVEQRCDLSWLRPGMFGTNDARLLLLFEELSVFDYKHGQGVTVEVEEAHEVEIPGGLTMTVFKPNIQLVYYAIGAAEACGWAFERVKITVVQPRKAHSDGPVRSVTFSKADLLVYAAELGEASDVCDRADAAHGDMASLEDLADWEAAYLKAGKHCQFCPAAGIPCPELERETYREAGVDFAEDGSISCDVMDEGVRDALLERAMRVIPILDVYIKAVETEALRRLRESQDGTGFGYKLVRKRSIRKWTADDTLVAEHLVEKGFPRELLFNEPKMRSPTQVEALRPVELMASLKAAKVKAPAQAIKAMIAELAHKPEGGLTIAPASDPREAVPPSCAAAGDFEAVEDE